MKNHPSNTIHEAADFLDALARFEAALLVERGALDGFDADRGNPTGTSYDDGRRQSTTARAIWREEMAALDAEVAALTRAAKERAARRMRVAGLDDCFAIAAESDDFGALAI